ncbi:unnamed protein product [Echinostoma caproni]|uniref:Mucin-like glycoprotein n=1 Tax=Echinostoma caproni TaxID=27848 RepID=A0A183B2Y5_9TREM|nr:unnamed protein product [Echinostoma caproni]
MKSIIIKLLLITFCISDIVAEKCEEVTASADAKSFVVKRSGTGCQYRVKSDSGKAVKVYVNETSGTNCVKATSGDKFETLCPKGTMTAFTSTSAIDVSADSVATSTSAATTTVTPTTTEAPKPPPSSGGGETEETHKGQAPSEKGKEGSQDPERKENAESENHNAASVEMSPMAAAAVPAFKSLIRQAREMPSSAGYNDVIVYYMLVTSTTTPTPSPKPSEEAGGKNESQKVPGTDEEKSKGKGPESQKVEKKAKGDSDNGAAKSASAGLSPQEAGAFPPADHIIRQAREAPTTAGSDDVTVYYVLGECEMQPDIRVNQSFA